MYRFLLTVQASIQGSWSGEATEASPLDPSTFKVHCWILQGLTRITHFALGSIEFYHFLVFERKDSLKANFPDIEDPGDPSWMRQDTTKIVDKFSWVWSMFLNSSEWWAFGSTMQLINSVSEGNRLIVFKHIFSSPNLGGGVHLDIFESRNHDFMKICCMISFSHSVLRNH